MRKQGDNKPVENFITDLYILVEHCGYNALHDEMIRDRIIVGIYMTEQFEKMQMESALTLEKGISLAQRSESVRMQQPTIRAELLQETDVEAVKGSKVSLHGKNGLPNKHKALPQINQM